MTLPQIASPTRWRAATIGLLAQEKAMTGGVEQAART